MKFLLAYFYCIVGAKSVYHTFFLLSPLTNVKFSILRLSSLDSRHSRTVRYSLVLQNLKFTRVEFQVDCPQPLDFSTQKSKRSERAEGGGGKRAKDK